jgi:hypothetical protein
MLLKRSSASTLEALSTVCTNGWLGTLASSMSCSRGGMGTVNSWCAHS